MNYGDAITAIKTGDRVTRRAWFDDRRWLAYSPGAQACPATNLWSPANKALAVSLGGFVDVLPAITMATPDRKIMMGYTPSQEDQLADDWEVVPQ